MNTFYLSSTQTERKQPETETEISSPDLPPAPEVKETSGLFPGIGVAASPEPLSIPLYTGELAFSCILIPRFSDHYLVGDVTEDLTEWMKQICISYGWRLNAILVRPGYLNWVMTVPLASNPAQFMRITRQQTSQKIFSDYPRFKQKNLSGDFWAPGYFVMAGDQLQSPESIHNFILMTRRQQGIV